ncbi:MAG: hypothetical protein HZB26_21065 [Candidatus Hydrogenedentes bacterium]|nr:hypothetical protein [Candidatus Hydrogenedentota bacterium]
MPNTILVAVTAFLLAASTVGCAGKSGSDSKDPAPAPSQTAPATIAFASAVKPILDARCGQCHAQDMKGGFSIQSLDTVLKGGKSGPAIAPGAAEGSLLYRMVTGKPGVKHMPQKGEPLAEAQLAVIKSWIDGGAK